MLEPLLVFLQKKKKKKIIGGAQDIVCVWEAHFALPSGTFLLKVGPVHCSRDPQISFFQQNKH